MIREPYSVPYAIMMVCQHANRYLHGVRAASVVSKRHCHESEDSIVGKSYLWEVLITP